jgi:hypothetical protein
MHRLLSVIIALMPAVALAQEDLTDRYREEAGHILGAALVDEEGWEKLEHLTTEIGHRLSGSEGLERTIEWAAGGRSPRGSWRPSIGTSRCWASA